MKKVIKLKESDLIKIVQRVLSEQSQPEEYYIGRATAILSKGPKPTEPGAKYCFTKNNINMNFICCKVWIDFFI